MEFTIDNKSLARVLSRAASVTAAKSPMPILQNALIEADGDTLRVRATDTRIGVELTAQSKVKTPGYICVEARHAYEVAKTLPNGEVKIQVEGTCCQIRAGRSKFKLPCIPGDDFPSLPRPSSEQSFTVEGRELARMLAQGAFAAVDDVSRPNLGGALFTPTDDGLSVVSTDGHRMAYAVGKRRGAVPRMIVPIGAHSEIKRLCEGVDGDVEVSCSGGYVFFTVGTETVSAKLSDVAFPPYEKVIPKSSVNTLAVARAPLIDMLKRIRVEAKNAKTGVHLVISEGSLAGEAVHADGEAYDSIDCDANFELRIGANIDYLIEAVSVLRDDEVVLAFNGHLDPILVKAPSGECLSVTMPLRV